MKKLTIATSQFPISSDIKKNSYWIIQHIKKAKKKNADIIHFPEACLSGYAGSQFQSFDNYDWQTLTTEVDKIKNVAKENNLWVILGSAHYQKNKKPFNSLYLISNEGKIIKRYDKCFRTLGDIKHYTGGHSLVTHKLKGIKFGLLICYDFRFPEIYRQYLLKKCRLIFHSFYQTSDKPNKLMMQVSPAHLTSRAAENFMYISANNVFTKFQWFNTRIYNPDGSILKQSPWNKAYLLVTEINLKNDKNFYNAIAKNAKRAACGYLFS